MAVGAVGDDHSSLYIGIDTYIAHLLLINQYSIYESDQNKNRISKMVYVAVSK